MPPPLPPPGPRDDHTLRRSLALLVSRRFGTFWAASLLSSIGTWTQSVAEPWLLLSMGASSFLVGLDSAAATAPAWVLTAFGGMLADRADRRRVIASFQSVQMLCPIAIVVLGAFGTLRPWMVIVLSFVVGVTDALSMPSFQSIVPSIVARDEIPYGLALNSTQFNLSRILGPALAGVLMSRASTLACFAVSALSYVPFIGVALWILPRLHARVASAGEGRRLPDLRGVLRQPAVPRALLTVFVTSTFCAPLVVFVPVLLRDVFRAGSGAFSFAVAAFGVGGLLGALILLAMPVDADRRHVSTTAAVVHALVLVTVGLARALWIVPAALVVGGAAMVVSNTSANTLIQSNARETLLGQSVSAYMMTMSAGLSLGALVTGATVVAWGPQAAIVVDGAVAGVLHLAIARLGTGRMNG